MKNVISEKAIYAAHLVVIDRLEACELRSRSRKFL